MSNYDKCSFILHKVALPDAEPLIHFALNCGAKGCPPIKAYSPEVSLGSCIDSLTITQAMTANIIQCVRSNCQCLV